MNILNDLSKKITFAGNEAINKTKDVADIAKLHFNKTDEERKLSELYEAIGKAYVEKHPLDYDEALTDIMNSIRDSKLKIEEYDQKIKELKKVNTCPVCGENVALNSNFCSNCGAKIEKKQEEAEAETEAEAENKSDIEIKDYSAQVDLHSAPQGEDFNKEENINL